MTGFINWGALWCLNLAEQRCLNFAQRYRNTFDWWKTIQNGFQGIQNPTPFVRTKAIKQDKKQLCAQIYGLLTSLHAITLEETGKTHWLTPKARHLPATATGGCPM